MEYLILALMGFLAALTPGPDIFYILRQSICYGAKVGFIAVFGILVGNIVYLTFVGLGVGALGESIYFQTIVGFLGGLYLLKIAYLTYIDKPHLQKSCKKLDSINLIKEALFLNLSNPKAMIFFAVVVTPFLTNSLFFSLVSLFIGIALAFIFAVFIASKIPINDKTLIVINRIASIVFIFFAFVLFKSAYNSFLILIM